MSTTLFMSPTSCDKYLLTTGNLLYLRHAVWTLTNKNESSERNVNANVGEGSGM